MICAGIVSYNPNIERLRKNAIAIKDQVGRVIIFDNGSQNADHVEKLCKECGIQFIGCKKNIGLAGALNQIFRNRSNEEKWFLLLDQDSICPQGYVNHARKFFWYNNVGIVSAGCYEKNLGERVGKIIENGKSYTFVKRCITSGSIVRCSAYNDVGGYDEQLFVDYVDFDFSVRIRQSGYKILHMNDILIEHELGESVKKRFLFWNFRYTKHSAEREYGIARNIIIFLRKYHKSENCFRDFMSLMKHYFLVIFYDRDMKKFVALCRGTIAGLKVKGKNV